MQKELIKVCKSQTSQVLFLFYFLSLVDIFVFFMDHCFVLELPVSTYSLFTLLFTTSRVRPYSFHRRHHEGVVVLTFAVLPLGLVHLFINLNMRLQFDLMRTQRSQSSCTLLLLLSKSNPTQRTSGPNRGILAPLDLSMRRRLVIRLWG